MANVWREPIFDRTFADVEFALRKIAEWKNTLVLETGAVYDLKGCLNLSDITRIEDNISFLSARLTQYGYHVCTLNKEWQLDCLPNVGDMKRIANNIKVLFEGFVTPSGADPIPEMLLSYTDINALEHNLYLLKEMLDIMEQGFIQSGTYKCGATTRLPLRR